MVSEFEKALKNLKLKFAAASLMLLAVFLAFSVLWNQSIKEELAAQANIYIRRGLKSGDSRGVLESLNGVRLASFESITHFAPDGHRIVTLPPSVGPVVYGDLSFFRRVVHGEVRTNLYFDETGTTPIGAISFVYNRFAFGWHAVAAWLLVMIGLGFLLMNAKDKIKTELQREVDLQNSKALADLVRKVRHNIRSPLAVLATYFGIPEDDALHLHNQGQRAVKRIEEILLEIEGRNKTENEKMVLVETTSLIEHIVEEKKLIAPHMDIQLSIATRPIYSAISARDFKATISNIIDNAIQAVRKPRGTITIDVQADGFLVSVEITDNGHGIATEFLSRVTEKGFSSKNGMGLGLYYAQKLMDENHGHLKIESQPAAWTRITLEFPQKVTPSWHCGEIKVSAGHHIHVRDDQTAVFEIWKSKFHKKNVNIKYHADEIGLAESPFDGNHLFLLDYDMGPQRKNGLEVISDLGLGDRAILVTGHFDEPTIQAACTTAGCRLLAKEQISSLPIVQLS